MLVGWLGPLCFPLISPSERLFRPYLAPSAIDFLHHASLLVCTRRKLTPLNLRPERRVGEKHRRVPAQMIHGAILRIDKAVAQLTDKYLV